MRLIDADKFKQQIAAITIRDNLISEKSNAICELIDRQPTAYDLDKVIENLDKFAHGDICGSCRSCRTLEDVDNIECEICGALGALEIVKSGGIHG